MKNYSDPFHLLFLFLDLGILFCQCLVCSQDAKLVNSVFSLDQKKSVKNEEQRGCLIEIIEENISCLYLIRIFFTNDSQHKIANHGKTQRKNHMANLLDQENSQNTIQNEK